VILAQTIKGYGLGEAGEGRNITHQQKKLNEQEIIYFRSRFEIPIPDEARSTASLLSSAGRQPRNRLHARAAAAVGRLYAQPLGSAVADQGAAAGFI
jgi:pyruvate dehydrogenase complex dehydrogenase (E1) component